MIYNFDTNTCTESAVLLDSNGMLLLPTTTPYSINWSRLAQTCTAAIIWYLRSVHPSYAWKVAQNAVTTGAWITKLQHLLTFCRSYNDNCDNLEKKNTLGERGKWRRFTHLNDTLSCRTKHLSPWKPGKSCTASTQRTTVQIIREKTHFYPNHRHSTDEQYNPSKFKIIAVIQTLHKDEHVTPKSQVNFVKKEK